MHSTGGAPSRLAAAILVAAVALSVAAVLIHREAAPGGLGPRAPAAMGVVNETLVVAPYLSERELQLFSRLVHLTGSLVNIEDYGDVAGLSLSGSSGEASYYVAEAPPASRGAFGDNSLYIRAPEGSLVRLSYTLPPQAVELLRGRRIVPGAIAMAVEGSADVWMELHLHHGSGRGGPALVSVQAGSGAAAFAAGGPAARIVGHVAAGVNVSATIVCTGPYSVSVSGAEAYIVPPPPPGDVLAYRVDPGRRAGITPVYLDRGLVALAPGAMAAPASNTSLLAPGGPYYPLLAGARVTLRLNASAAYLVLAIGDPVGEAFYTGAPVRLEGQALEGSPPSSELEVTLQAKGWEYSVTLNWSPLTGTYLLPLRPGITQVTVTLENRGRTTLSIDLGLAPREAVTAPKSLQPVPLRANVSLPAILAGGGALELAGQALSSGWLLLSVNLSIREPANGSSSGGWVETIALPPLHLDASSVAGPAVLPGDVVMIPSDIDGATLSVMVASRGPGPAELALDRIEVKYKPVIIVEPAHLAIYKCSQSPSHAQPGPGAAGADRGGWESLRNCAGGLEVVGRVNYTTIMTLSVESIEYVSLEIPPFYKIIIDISYTVIGDGSIPSSHGPMDPVLELAVALDFDRGGVTVHSFAIVTLNDEGIPAQPLGAEPYIGRIVALGLLDGATALLGSVLGPTEVFTEALTTGWAPAMLVVIPATGEEGGRPTVVMGSGLEPSGLVRGFDGHKMVVRRIFNYTMNGNYYNGVHKASLAFWAILAVPEQSGPCNLALTFYKPPGPSFYLQVVRQALVEPPRQETYKIVLQVEAG